MLVSDVLSGLLSIIVLMTSAVLWRSNVMVVASTSVPAKAAVCVETLVVTRLAVASCCDVISGSGGVECVLGTTKVVTESVLPVLGVSTAEVESVSTDPKFTTPVRSSKSDFPRVLELSAATSDSKAEELTTTSSSDDAVTDVTEASKDITALSDDAGNDILAASLDKPATVAERWSELLGVTS